MRWKGSLAVIPRNTPERHMREAIYWLGSAISDDGQSTGRPDRLAAAGAHVRAARKGLGVESSRRKDDGAVDDTDVLLYAIRCATYALAAGDSTAGAANWLRTAEACLRTMWKRGQARG